MSNLNTSNRIWTILIISIVALPVISIMVYGSGERSGKEFSPDDFMERRFSYNQTPLVNWVLRKKTYSDSTPFVAKELIAEGLIIPIRSKIKPWHLTSDSGSSVVVSHDCDARFLTEMLDEIGDDNESYFWLQWNEKYPKSAKIFWPMIADLARKEMYLKIPEVLDWASEVESDNPEEFEKLLNEKVALLYLEMGTIDFDLNRHLRAGIRLKRSLELADRNETQKKLDECLEKLGGSADQVINPEPVEIIDLMVTPLDYEYGQYDDDLPPPVVVDADEDDSGASSDEREKSDTKETDSNSAPSGAGA